MIKLCIVITSLRNYLRALSKLSGKEINCNNGKRDVNYFSLNFKNPKWTSKKYLIFIADLALFYFTWVIKDVEVLINAAEYKNVKIIWNISAIFGHLDLNVIIKTLNVKKFLDYKFRGGISKI